jgi:hypothetical protein
MKLLGQAALTITPGMTKTRVLEETNRLIQWLGGNTSQPKQSTQPTPTQTTPAKTGSTSAGKAKALSLMK